MTDYSGQQISILTTWWWQRLGRDWHRINKQVREFIWTGSISRNLLDGS
jgi:hypothetical protein